MKEEAKKWIVQAKKDLNTANVLLDNSCNKEASFFCQQSAEKALKAVLIESKDKFPKSHDLVKLGKQAGLPKYMIPDCEKLTAVYIDARYPDTGTDEYDSTETSNDIKIAKRILEWAQKKI